MYFCSSKSGFKCRLVQKPWFELQIWPSICCDADYVLQLLWLLCYGSFTKGFSLTKGVMIKESYWELKVCGEAIFSGQLTLLRYLNFLHLTNQSDEAAFPSICWEADYIFQDSWLLCFLPNPPNHFAISNKEVCQETNCCENGFRND